MKKLLALSMIIIVVITAGLSATASEDPALSKKVFYVTWYGVGNSALEGLEGVKKVESGFLNSREINTVYYDARLISMDEMIKALKDAGTFLGVAE